MLLKTKRLIIRPFTMEDLDPLSSLFGDQEVMRFSLAGALSREQTQDYLEKRILGHYAQFGFGLWAVVHSENQQLIGSAGLMMQSIDGEDLVELGYRLDPKYWGKGLASEAALAISQYAFDRLPLDQIISIIDPKNTRSLHVAARLGMRHWKDTLFHNIPVQIYVLPRSRIKQKVEVSETKPPNFQAKMEASACYLEIDGQLLLIQQAVGKSEEGRWGVPAGKLELNETPEAAAKRELFEETGIQIQSPPQIQFLGTLYIRKPDLDYVYHMFKIHLDEKPEVHLSFEHTNYKWVHPKDFGDILLRAGVEGALEYYQPYSNGL